MCSSQCAIAAIPTNRAARRSIARVRTVLFVGAGRHQRRAILQAKARRLRVVAVDRNPDAPGLREADIAKVVDFADPAAVLKATARLRLDGVLTVSADRAVPVVAAVAEARGLPGIGVATAHLMTHKIAMRRALAEAGVPQPRFAAVRTLSETRRAADEVGFPAVLKPADSGGQRGVFRVESARRTRGPLSAATAIGAPIRSSVTIVALPHETFSRAASGIGFGVGWIHVYPPTIPRKQFRESERVAAHTVHALGLRTGIAFPQLIAADDGRVVVVECAARIPGGQMADLVRVAVGVDLVDVQLAIALGEPLPDELVNPQFSQPLAIRFFTAEPGPLPAGRVVRIGPLDKVLAFPGVVQADTYLTVGEIIRPVRLDGDRRGYVIATAGTNLEALARAEAAARLLDVEVEPP